MWYQWKARNNKCFSNQDTTPLKTLQLACQEAEAWRMAQMVETTFTAEENNHATAPHVSVELPCLWRCQVDASWLETSDGVGMGFILYEQETQVLRVQGKRSQTDSPLHAEAKCLCWVMKEIRNRGLARVYFESDCQQLVHIIQQKKKWPALEPVLQDIQAIKSSVDVFSLKYIPRSANVRSDGLSKDARSRVQSFSSFKIMDTLRLAVEASLYEHF
ncbi:hypothetical protein DY000_02031549 [Brassica cretica]|uniref:RNase H type-1 domain-containing protein n=1 Tax=Brassica cretica TaxID=69181 RepID=A0ABQ7DX03_BRACR|nr:hypothetical protein DY000_02031549 [Brassica cretica]